MVHAAIQIDALMTGTVLAVLGIAVREDMLRQRIPNALNASALLLGIGLASLIDGLRGLVDAAGGAAIGTAVLLPFYLLRGMGAGDVKLMAATGSFLGCHDAITAGLLTLIAGFFLGIAFLVRHVAQALYRQPAAPSDEAMVAWRALATVLSLRRARFPYALAIGVGVVATLVLNGALAAFWGALWFR